MNKCILSPLLGLLIIVSGLVFTTSASAFELRNLYEGTCLGVAAGNPNPGGKMVLWACDGSPNQQFTAVPTSYTNSNGEPLYTLYDGVAANRVLGVAPAPQGSVLGTVVTWTVDYSANQQWTMTPVYTDHQGHQCYAIRSNGTLTMLTPSNRNTSIGSTYLKQNYGLDNNGNVVLISTTYGDQSGNGYGTQDQGDTVGASYYVWGAGFFVPWYNWWYQTDTPQLVAASFWTNYSVHFTYDPNSYSAQYWCMY